MGKAPFETHDITAGSHQINVSAEGHDGMSQRVEVSADAPTEVTFSLKATVLDTAVQVVHKHRLGSCEGRLSATLAGIRYAPTTGDDAFRAPLAAIETFVVDYRDKELRLKVKGGKGFTFTTKAVNADPLVVFHRDVDKALIDQQAIQRARRLVLASAGSGADDDFDGLVRLPLRGGVDLLRASHSQDKEQ